MNSSNEKLFQAILTGDQDQAVNETQVALDEGMSAAHILNEGLIRGMKEVGRLYENGEYYVPEMLISARAMKAALNLLRPLLVESDVKPMGKMVVGTVKGDLHDIGKNLVAIMVEGAGFEIIDLGTDVSPEEFVEAIKESEADLVGLSALLTTTTPMMEKTIQAIQEAGLRDRVNIIIGGAPTTPEFAEKIGADGYAPDASRAATLAQKMISS